MRWNCMSKALRFLQITAEHQDCPFFTVFLTTKSLSQNISITLLQISLKLHEHRGHYWTKKLPWTILEEQFPVPWNTAASKIGNSVISLLWQLRCRCNPDHDKFSSLSNTTVVAIFPNVCLWRGSLCWNLVLIQKNCIEPPSYASTTYGVSILPSFLFDCFVKIWQLARFFWANGLPPPPPRQEIALYDYIHLKVDLPMFCTLSCSSIQFSRAEKFAPWVIFSFPSEGNSKFCDDVTNNFTFLELKISFATNSVALIRLTCSPWFSIQSSSWIRNSKLSSNIIVYLLKSLFTPSAFSFQILDYLRSNDKYIQEPFQRNHRLNIYIYNLRTQPWYFCQSPIDRLLL